MGAVPVQDAFFQLLHPLVADVDPFRVGAAVEDGGALQALVMVVVAAMPATASSLVMSGRARQVRVMWQNSRCSILFHLDVPGQCRCLSCANYRSAGAVAGA